MVNLKALMNGLRAIDGGSEWGSTFMLSFLLV
jgi:hypothetical protein